MGPQTGDPRNFKSYEEVWKAFETQMKYFVKQGAIVTNMYDFIHGELTPQPFYSACSLNPMETGIDATRGGTRYNVLCPQAVGVVDVGDSLAAIKKLVFEEKIITMAELIDALDTNFAGKENFRQLLINRAPKYGNDDPYVDEIVVKVSELWCREVEQYTIPRRHGRQPERVRTEEEKRMVRELEKKYGKCDIDDGHHSPGIYTVISNVPFGKMCEALPSGRLAGTPLADGGISPQVGRDQLGPTAVFKSAAKIKHVLASNGTLLNQRFTPRTLQGEDGTRNLASLIKSYHDMGGNHVQFNVVSSKTLREAQRKPNDYQGLMVRVAGYSAFFNALMPETQDNIIHRAEQGEGR
jgi:formate C-acetyltransferase